MSTQPFFIGRMTDPVVAHVLHLSALDFQVTKFLREQIKNHTLSENDSVVLIADAHLNAKPSALRLLRRGITSTNIKIAGVFGDHGQIWAQYMDIPYLTEKPRMSMNAEALELRRTILQNALENEQQNELNVVCNIVNNAIDQVDKAQELHSQRSELLSFEQRQQQQREADPSEPKQDTASKSLDDLRLALQQRKVVKDPLPNPEVVNAAPEMSAVEDNLPSDTAVVDTQPLEQELETLLNTPAAPVQTPTIPTTEPAEKDDEPAVVNQQDPVSADVVDAEDTPSLSEDEQKVAEEEDRNFELRKHERYVIQSSLKFEAPCQSSLGQELPARPNMTEGRIAVKPLRVRGRIRSGQTLHHGGDVIVEGSVHPSGEVAASGDIHVYGTGGGRLFAGIDGNINACIYIAVFDAEIVSIAGHYHVIEDSYNNWSGRSIKISLEDGILNFEEIRLTPQRAA